MQQFEGYTFAQMTKEDIDRVAPLMKRAFDEDARRHLGEAEGGPDGYDNGDFIRKWYFSPYAQPYVVAKDGRSIGAVNVFIRPDGHNYLGNMFVDTALQNRGAGRVIWRFIEKTYPETKVWRTDTPAFSVRNHHFYINKLGFHVVEIKDPKNPREASYQLEKVMKV